ncbi:hypothetical protein [Chitinimonas sp. BJYL2]|uniref:hypothetical protein n=1 Tax=Chitinimonas sp. BJYL2 TaxID=2976696 RepID=UPI0022B44708|nr:hypothetical protein [Chitinimonas sp. BJYL2]
MNPRSKPLLAIVAGDPGGGAALVPVVELLDALQWPCRLYAYAESLQSWTGRGWPVSPAESIRLDGVSGVICGTSVNAQMMELDWLLAARARGLPTLSVLDFWSNYAPRFEKQGETVRPDRIAIPDALARAEMMAAGFPESALIITGQPALDSLAGIVPPGTARRRALRDTCGVQPEQPLAVFVSQPLRMMAQRLGEAVVIDEQKALQLLEQALAQRGKPIALRVKPHPREPRSDFAHIGSVWPGTALAPDGLAHELLMTADIVVGIHSMMLLEACYLGCRVLSFQPGLSAASDPLPSNRAGWSWRCDNPAELAAMLDTALSSTLPVPSKPDGQAAQRVIEAMERLITT